MANKTQTFKEAYSILQGHAQTLRNQTEPNIDDLLSIVEESVGAYRICKERIDAVEKALEKALTDVEDGDGNFANERVFPRSPVTPNRIEQNDTKRSSCFDDMDDDIPF